MPLSRVGTYRNLPRDALGGQVVEGCDGLVWSKAGRSTLVCEEPLPNGSGSFGLVCVFRKALCGTYSVRDRKDSADTTRTRTPKPTRPAPLGFNPFRGGGVLGSDLPLWLAAKMDPGQNISAIADFDPEPFPRRGTARVMQLPCSGFNLVHKSPPQLPV